MRYDAFISYSSAADERLAPQIQRGLERLAKPWTKRRSLRVFRDNSALAVSPHLWDSIAEALDDSDWFIVLASPTAAQSLWVNREIEHWLASHPDAGSRVLPVVTDGRWQWNESISGFTPDSTAVPDALRDAFRSEPRHLDLRWARDSDELELRNSRFRAGIADLAAPIHGIPKDELESEDIRAHKRTVRVRRLAIGALATFAVAVAVLAVVALILRERAVESEAIAVANEERAVESEAIAVANEERAVESEAIAVANEERAVESEAIAVANEERAVESEAIAVANEERAVESEARAVANERRAVQNARTADARRLAAQSASLVRDETDLAALLAIESDRLDATDEGAEALALVMTSPIRSVVVPHAPAMVPLTADGNPLGTWTDPSNTHVPCFDPSDPPIASADDPATGTTAVLWQDGRLWMTGDGGDCEPNARFAGLGNSWKLAFSPDGSHLAVVGGSVAGGWGRILSTTNPTDPPVELVDAEQLQGVAFSRDGRAVFTGGEEGVLRRWDPSTGTSLDSERIAPSGCGACITDDWIFDLDVGPDGNLAAATGSGVVVLSTTEEGSEVIEMPGDLPAFRAQFDAGGSLFVWFQGGTIKKFDIDRPVESASDHAAMAFAIDASRDGHVVATGGFDGRVVVTDDRNGERWEFPADSTLESDQKTSLLADAPLVFSVAVDPSGRYVASASVGLPPPDNDRDGVPDTPSRSAVVLWDLQTSDAYVLEWVDAFDVAFTPEGHVAMAVAQGGLGELVNHASYRDWPQQGRVDVWDPSSGGVETLTTLDEMAIGIDVSPDGERIATSTAGGSVHLFDRSSPPGFLAADPVDGWGWALRVRFSDDGRTLASSGNSGQVVLWDVGEGLGNKRVLLGHDGWVGGIAFLDDDSVVATAGSADAAVRLWSRERGVALGRPIRTAQAATGVASGADGAIVVSTGDGGLSVRRRAPAFDRGEVGGRTTLPGPSSWSRDVCSVAGRNLTRQEWSTYLGDVDSRVATCPAFTLPD